MVVEFGVGIVLLGLMPFAWASIAMLAVAAGFILLVLRMVGFGAVVAAPLFAAAITDAVRLGRPQRPGRAEKLVVGLGALAMLVGLALAVPNTADHPGGVPTAFSARLSALPPHTVVFGDAPMGSWLVWSHPDLDPVVDGMLDAYPVSYLRSIAGANLLVPGWQRTVRRTGATVAILENGTPLVGALQAQLGWHEVAHTPGWVYLTRS
jgi:hypothetical protein